MTRSCSFCGEPVNLLREGARFCSGRCRVAAHRARGKFPRVMRDRASWVRAVGKRPITVDGAPASSTSPETWSAFQEVQESPAGDGYGFMLGSGVGCYDLDSVTQEQARDFLASIPEQVLFVERSRSGNGFHIFVEAAESPGWKRVVNGMKVERYTRERFILTTGEAVKI